MLNEEVLIKFLQANTGQRIDNYIVPGLSSLLLDKVKPRMFVASREQERHIVPHTHRYDLFSIVLQGWVVNSIYTEEMGNMDADLYTRLAVKTENFEYTTTRLDKSVYLKTVTTYNVGEGYYMPHDTFHSIKFSRDAVVLILEGREITKTSHILLPTGDNDQLLGELDVKEWMFKKPTIVHMEEP